MGRVKGQVNLESSLGWVTPDSVPPSSLKNYLCALGPGYCLRCPSKCAFGVRHIENLCKKDEKLAARVAAFRRRMM